MSLNADAEKCSLEIKQVTAVHATDYEIKIREGEEAFDWNAMFDNAQPVEIEIGCGRGMFIIKRALENPAINFLGVEKSARFFRMLKERVVKSGAHNIRIMRTEAAYLMKKFVPANSVQAVHVYFPDPWPKKRHRKRRLVNGSFFESVARVLLPGGLLFFATDFQDYFDEIIAMAPSCRTLTKESNEKLSSQDVDPDTAATTYERKYLMQGRVIYRAVYKKIK
jgi:tRNA (guanine-N7-)-methyltransferase